jgi:hypothetical protein
MTLQAEHPTPPRSRVGVTSFATLFQPTKPGDVDYVERCARKARLEKSDGKFYEILASWIEKNLGGVIFSTQKYRQGVPLRLGRYEGGGANTPPTVQVSA